MLKPFVKNSFTIVIQGSLTISSLVSYVNRSVHVLKLKHLTRSAELEGPKHLAPANFLWTGWTTSSSKVVACWWRWWSCCIGMVLELKGFILLPLTPTFPLTFSHQWWPKTSKVWMWTKWGRDKQDPLSEFTGVQFNPCVGCILTTCRPHEAHRTPAAEQWARGTFSLSSCKTSSCLGDKLTDLLWFFFFLNNPVFFKHWIQKFLSKSLPCLCLLLPIKSNNCPDSSQNFFCYRSCFSISRQLFYSEWGQELESFVGKKKKKLFKSIKELYLVHY